MERQIKKYGNRKLYDTTQSKYISLRDIKGFIREGDTVSIVEKETGEDITSEILTKAILDDKEDKNESLSPGMLHNIIRWGSSTIETGISKVGERINRMIPVAGIKEFESLAKQVEDLENKVEKLQNKLKDK